MTTPTSNLGLLKGVDSDNWRTYLKTSLAASLDVLDKAIGQVYNVKGYGATGNGSTDDSAAILAAIAAVPSTGGTVRFSSGTYRAPNLTVITRSNLTIELNGAMLKTSFGLNLVGNNNVVDLGGGTIDGGLTYTTISTSVPSGTNQITVTDASVFAIGDGVQSSYGLGGDGANPDVITNIVGNTLTVTSNSFGILPSGSKIGTWIFNATVALTGSNNVLRNGTINLARGIAIYVGTGSSQVTVENVKVTNSGLQSVEVVNSTKVVFRNCSFGNILDAAKQSVGIDGAATEVAFVDCSFKPLNFDALFYLGGVGAPGTDEASVVLERCVLDAVNGVLQAPYSANGAAIYHNAGMIRQLTLRDCVVKNYRFGIASDVNTAAGASAKRVVLDGCDFSAGIAPYTWYAASHVPSQVLAATNCRFNATVSDFWSTAGTFHACTFDACAFDISSAFGGRMTDCVFLSCTGVRFQSTAYLDGCSFTSTTIGTYPYSGADKLLGELHMSECSFDHADFPAGTLSNVLSLQADHVTTGHLREATSTLPVVFYANHAGGVTYIVDCRVFYQPYPTQLRNKDWLIPLGSRFRRLGNGAADSVVIKANGTSLNGAVSTSATTIVVASASGFAIGDVLNVLCTDGRVHTTIASSVSGTTIGLTDAMPTGASTGAGVCSYTYASVVDADPWTAYTPTWTGFSAAPTGGLRYKQVGKTVFVRSAITGNGTSHASAGTVLTFTLPVTAQSTQVGQSYGLGIDNGATVTTPCRIDLSSTTVATCYTSPAAAGWTNGGGKAIHFSFTYEAG